MARRTEDFSGRIGFVGILFFLAAGVLVYRLFNLQIIKADYYRDQANRQYLGSQLKSPIADRGTIYFKEKSGHLVSAAVVKEGSKLVINPSALKSPEEAYEKISGIIPLEKENFISRATKENDVFEEIVKKVDQEKADLIKKLNIEGVDIIPDEWRFYPGGKLASHVLGFVGYNNDGLSGQYGVEKYYNEKLKGNTEENAQDYFSEAFLGIKKEIFLRFSGNEKDITLTIEPSVQGFLEASLEKVLNEYSAESAGGIIIDPKTGKILAMAAKPDFDPNFYNKVENHGVFLNPLVSNIFEIGSVMKPITLASALDKGSIKPETTYYDNGYLIIDKARIENYDAKGRGRVNMQTVLNKSLNTGAVFAMRQMGKDDFQKYVTNFGLGEKTGVDLPDEVKGDVASLNGPREIEAATASFGQGIAITPIEFVAAFSALANGGNLVQPYIIETQSAGEENKPIIKRQVIKKDTSEEITRMLSRVVDEALLEGTVKLEHYSVAAKTGTAQIPNENAKGYSEEYLHSFIGYAPAFDAKFLTFLYVKKPQGVKYASNSLTHPFMDITKFLLNYYDVAPDR